jgi:hypothetical protein
MPDLKISQLPAATTPLAGTELVPIVQGGVTDQTTVQAILTGTVPSGTANGVLYLNGSKVVSSGSALTFDGTNLGVGKAGASPLDVVGTFTWNSNLAGTDKWLRFTGGAGLIYDGTTTATDIAWLHNGGEAMRLDSTGLGIGTSSPAYKLSVNGVIHNNTYAFISQGAQGTSSGLVFSGLGSNYGRVYESGNDLWSLGYGSGPTVAPTAVLSWNSSGNLGLGVTPSAWGGTYKVLQLPAGAISADSTAVIEMRQNSRWAGSANVYVNNGFASNYYQYNGTHAWFTAPSGTAGNPISFTQAMTLDASGNLGIGATSPAEKLDVYGGASGTVTNAQVGNAATAFLLGVDSSNNCQLRTAQSVNMLFYTAATERARIPATGGMVVGTAAIATTATDGFLYVPTCAGTPTGTPTTQTGTAPIVVDTTNHKLYFYSGGTWRDAGP